MTDIQKILKKRAFTEEEIVRLLSATGQERKLLFERAAEIRDLYKGHELYLRGMIEISNYCESDCFYCSYSANSNVKRFRLTAAEAIEEARVMIRSGIRNIVLSSGEDPFFDKDMISYIIYSIKKISNVYITLCFGRRSFDEYKAWKYSGADRYIFRFDLDSQKSNYLENEYLTRLEHFQYLSELGYSVGKLNVIGFPGQKLRDIARELLLAKKLDCDVVALLPFLNEKKYDEILALTLNSISVLRLLLRESDLVIPGNFELVNGNRLNYLFKAGVNVIIFGNEKNNAANNALKRDTMTNYYGDFNRNYIKFRKLVENYGIKLHFETFGDINPATE